MDLNEIAAVLVIMEEADREELARMVNALRLLEQKTDCPDEAKKLIMQAVGMTQSLLGLQENEPSYKDTFTQTMKALGVIVNQLLEKYSIGDQRQESVTPASLCSQTVPAREEEEAGERSEAEIDKEILVEFITESLDHLENVEAQLLALESNPQDQDPLNSAFRAFHSIKGTAFFLELKNIEKLAHNAEMLLDRARKKEIEMKGAFADLALNSADMLSVMIKALKEYEGGPVPSAPSGFGRLLDLLAHPDKAGAGEALEPAPVSSAKTTQASASAVPPDSQTKAVPPAVSAARKQNQAPEQAQAAGHSAREAADATVRVSTRRLDHLINMLGELVITHAMIAQHQDIAAEKDRALSRNVSQLGKITRNLQDVGMSMRMVPLKGTFQKMERVARDIARKSGKSIFFRMDGEETEIDRNMVEALNDPLVHMIRNAVDHGLESEAQRGPAGKPRQGSLLLRAYHATGNVVIEIKDDGRGLDREKIKAKAMEKNLISRGQELTDHDIYQLIFAPGFSTSDQVTTVSGRGVGMDVVKKNIESLRGRVDIQSTPGQGTQFTLQIPMTLAVIDGLLLNAGSQQYIVPTLNVKQALRPEEGQLSTVKQQGEMLMLRNTLLPVFRLHRLFHLPDAEEDPTRALLVVVEHDGKACALLVDSLLGQQQVVIKSLGRGFEHLQGISGAAILGDGRIRLILDIAGVIDMAWQEETPVAARVLV